MCNEYEQKITYALYCEMMQALGWGVPANESERDLPQSAGIRISDPAPVMRAAGNSVALAEMRFGFPPMRPNSGPVFNWRSEGRRFAESNRCLIPASAFFEFTGSKSPKTKHRFSLKDAPMMAIAGIWKQVAPEAPPHFAMLTTEPGPDVKPYHDRQVVVLRPENWPHWIHLSKPEGELLQPLPAGSLAVETVRRPAKEKGKRTAPADLFDL
ncbi:MAG TPA: SOS response-associated peptidase family protein [Dongiaceae bacterium]|jgi:putative SOS response-associated peptidase YedK|nr:SOS response-associated peptidase family protein [Dongiaceae bacterium]